MTFSPRKKEILTDILVRLPAKSLIRFMCACKSWRDLIGSSSFVSTNLHRNVTKHGHTYLLCLHNPSCEFADDPDDPSAEEDRQWSLFSEETFEQCLELSHPLGSTKHFGIYGSSNGLVCISDENLNYNSPVHIWNPSVRKLRTLPLSNNTTKFGYVALHFGFHPRLNDYRAVRMIRTNTNSFLVEVYSLRTDSWKMIEVIPDWLKGTWKNYKGRYFNGVAYNVIGKGPKLSIMSFDSGSEEFEEFMAPDASLKPRELCIDVYKEQICLLFRYDGFEEGMCKIHLWVLQEKRWKELCPFTFPVYERGYGAIGFSTNDGLLVERRDYDKGVADLCLGSYESKQVLETGINLAIMTYGEMEFLYSMIYVESLETRYLPTDV